jgi:hypothetical protein
MAKARRICPRNLWINLWEDITTILLKPCYTKILCFCLDLQRLGCNKLSG